MTPYLHKWLGRFVRFSAVGAVGTGVHYAILVLLVEGNVVGSITASIYGFIVGALVNYILNRQVTFRSTRPHMEALTRFMIIAAAGALINIVIMSLGVTLLKVHYLLAQIGATATVLMLTFLGNSLWTFQEPHYAR